MTGEIRTGDLVIFHSKDHSRLSGVDTLPDSTGSTYPPHHLDRFWVVVSRPSDDQVRIRNQAGGECQVDVLTEGLRPASWWEVLFHRRQFSSLLETHACEPVASQAELPADELDHHIMSSML